jgi:uncharacterized protein (TIGR02001 family)
LTSDYRWRGQTQAQNDPAVQGGFTLGHTSGLYFSAFASNVDFGGTAHLELDPQIGFSKAIKLGPIEPTLDVGLVYYNYPSESDINWWEAYGKLVFANVITEGDSLTPSLAYTGAYGGDATSDAWGEDIANFNVNLAYAIPFADTGFGGVASIGYSKADEAIYGSGTSADDNFVDWKVGVNYTVKAIKGLSAELAAVGSNIDGYTGAAERAVDTGAVFTLTKTF